MTHPRLSNRTPRALVRTLMLTLGLVLGAAAATPPPAQACGGYGAEFTRAHEIRLTIQQHFRDTRAGEQFVGVTTIRETPRGIEARVVFDMRSYRASQILVMSQTDGGAWQVSDTLYFDTIYDENGNVI